ncbi:MAG TPA: hypothetical protein VMG33_03725 [Steroidobacteraceae bacterium]|nr:hypothetical protein [Steroidobacteraceae bacterium]
MKRVEPVLQAHQQNGALARAFARLCAETAQPQCAFLFGEYWREDAITAEDHAKAVAFMSGLNPLSQPH